jgi:transposase
VTHDIGREQRGPPITRLSDQEWEKVQPLLAAHDPPKRRGRKRADPRGVLEAIIYRQRSGRQWNSLPKEYPDDSTVHRTYLSWRRLGILDRLLAMVEEVSSSDPANEARP